MVIRFCYAYILTQSPIIFCRGVRKETSFHFTAESKLALLSTIGGVPPLPKGGTLSLVIATFYWNINASYQEI